MEHSAPASPRTSDDPVMAAIGRLDERLQTVGLVATRLGRIEDETMRLRESVVVKSDLAMVGTRVEALASRIDHLGEQVAATAPRLRTVETSVADLRATAARQTELAALERSVSELAGRVDSHENRQSARAARLSSQVTGWLVSLLLLIVGAMVSYALIGPR